jgi:hypothetical protein
MKLVFAATGKPVPDGRYSARLRLGKLEFYVNGRFVEVVVKPSGDFSSDFSNDFAGV